MVNIVKKSQVFFVDMMISFIFLLIVFVILYSFNFVSYSSNEVYSINSNVVNSFFNTNINDLNEEYVVSLFREGRIKNIKFNIAQQVAYFYFLNDKDSSRNLTKIFANTIIPSKINIEIFLNHDLLYNKTSKISFENSRTSAYSSRLVYGSYNSTTMFGPYLFEVRTWQ